MPTKTDLTIEEANQHLLTSVEEQIRDLQPGLQKQVEIATLEAELRRLKTLVDNSSLVNTGLAHAITNTSEIRSGTKTLADFGEVLLDLYSFQQSLQVGLETQQITNLEKERFESVLLSAINRVRQLLNYRPDVNAVMDDLTALKNLKGGPAEATAFHDFQVLQLAFKSVWLHAFDEKLEGAVLELYKEAFSLYEDVGQVPNFDPLNDIDDLNSFINEIKNIADPNYKQGLFAPPPLEVSQYFPEAVSIWNLFSDEQRNTIIKDTNIIFNYAVGNEPDKTAIIQDLKDAVAPIIKYPQGRASRLIKLISEIGKYLSEPYSFDIFAPNSYNFGLMATYRQKWEPGEYQAGDLVATIPLAPGESRKFSKKRVVKTSRAEKEIEKSMSSRSLQSSEASRAEAEIINKVSTATNFKLTVKGGYNTGISSLESTTDFMTNQDQQSAQNKKEFHEATIKAAEEYRLERSIEVDTTSVFETEETTSGEISNPNNEITITYLFYELQRRFKIHEFLYRVRPVILVAQDVPAPHEIDEAWLIQYQWIISRVLLDDSLRPALTYLTSGLGGDEVSLEIIKAQWEAQFRLVQALEGQTGTQLNTRNKFRDELTAAALDTGLATAFDNNQFLGMGPDAAPFLEAFREAAETRLKYTEEALVGAQEKLKHAAAGLEQATKEYATAVQNQFARHVAIDQLRVHVKQNIIYYMQAIWDHEPTDQRFFRLYKQKVACIKADPKSSPSIVVSQITKRINGRNSYDMEINNRHLLDNTDSKVQLIEVADLDNPLGYKGNYIIFPMKGECYLTQYMLSGFINDYLGVRDPDGSDDFDAEKFDQDWKEAVESKDQVSQAVLKEKLNAYITAIRRSTDEIIVPTGQLFIEALPGSHPLLEDFKLLHRMEDVRKVKAEIRHAELENLRLASRLVGGQGNDKLLDDPDIEKVVVVDGKTGVIVPP